MMGLFGGLWMWFWMVGWFVLMGLLLWGGCWLARRDQSTRNQESALDILKRRYAGGEISAVEFEQAKRALL